MKNKTAFILVFFFNFYLLCGTVFADSEFSQRIEEFLKNPDYVSTMLKAYDIEHNAETGVTTFKNESVIADSDERDTNTYIIDSQTLVHPYVKGYLNFEDFLEGRAPYVTGFILKSDSWGYSDAKGREVHLAVADSFSKSISTMEKTEAFERLESYGIMTRDDIGSFCPYDTVTRAIMAKILMCARNITKLENPAEFLDVASDHWANNYIGNAQKSGYLCGFEDGTFRPEETVTTQQVIKMIVCLLGYEPVALQRGSYPNGYIAVAESIGLLDNITELELDSVCIRKTIAEIMNNALDIPLMMQTYYTKDKEAAEYAVFDGVDRPLETIVSYYFS